MNYKQTISELRAQVQQVANEANQAIAFINGKIAMLEELQAGDSEQPTSEATPQS